MQSFTIIIKRDTHNQFTIEATGPQGIRVAPQPFVWQPTDVLTDTLSQLADENARVPQPHVEALGQALYDALFTREMAVAFSQAQNKVGEKNLRLRLQIEPPELAALPWEAMRNREGWLGLDRAIPLVRISPHVMQARDNTLQIDRPLRVLFVGASPTDLAKLEVEKQYIELKAQLSDLISKKVIRLESLFHPDRKELSQALLNDYHIIYFAGHGEPSKTETSFDGSKTVPARIFINETAQTEERDGQLVPIAGQKYGLAAEELAGMLRGRKQTRLVFLAACNTDAVHHQATAENPDSALLSGFAEELTQRAKLPAMVAMQYYISDQQALSLTAQFFAALSKFTPVDTALAEARTVTVKQGQPLGRDVFAPVMYLQAENSALFKRARNWVAVGLIALLGVIIGVSVYTIWELRQQQGIEQTRTANSYATSTAEAIRVATQQALEQDLREKAERAQQLESRKRQSHSLASRSDVALAQGRIDLGLLLAQEAIQTFDTNQARTAVLDSLQYSRNLHSYLYYSARGMDISPNGDYLAIGYINNNEALVNLVDLRLPGYNINHTFRHPLNTEGYPFFNSIYDLDISPDGRYLPKLSTN